MPRMLAVAWSLAALAIGLGLGSPPGAHAAGFMLFEQSGRAMGSAYAGEGAIALHRGIPPYPETVQYVQRVLENSRRPSHSDYRFYKDAGSDGTLTYSNLPPGLRPRPLGR